MIQTGNTGHWIVKCKYCGEEVERVGTNKKQGACCFTCKMKNNAERSKKQVIVKNKRCIDCQKLITNYATRCHSCAKRERDSLGRFKKQEV